MTADGQISIGMMRGRGGPNAISLAAAHAALMQGARFFFFNPQDVDLESEAINGLFFEDGGWVRRKTGFPDVIDNDPFPPDLPEVWEAMVRKARITTPKTLGGKLEVDRRMREAGLFPDLVIPTVLAGGAEDLVRQLEIHREIVAKPVHGGRGRMIVYLARTDNGYRINVDGRNWRADEGELRTFYDRRLTEEPYLIQKHIRSRTHGGQPFDLRLFVRRNGKAEWQPIWIIVRIGSGRTIASNVATGGTLGYGRQFLHLRFGVEQGERIFRQMERLNESFPVEFQTLYPELTIDALGIDIGLDPAGKPWLFEVNCYPGPDFTEIVEAVPRIGYALYLARNPDFPDAIPRG